MTQAAAAAAVVLQALIDSPVIEVRYKYYRMMMFGYNIYTYTVYIYIYMIYIYI